MADLTLTISPQPYAIERITQAVAELKDACEAADASAKIDITLNIRTETKPKGEAEEE